MYVAQRKFITNKHNFSVKVKHILAHNKKWFQNNKKKHTTQHHQNLKYYLCTWVWAGVTVTVCESIAYVGTFVFKCLRIK